MTALSSFISKSKRRMQNSPLWFRYGAVHRLLNRRYKKKPLTTHPLINGTQAKNTYAEPVEVHRHSAPSSKKEKE